MWLKALARKSLNPKPEVAPASAAEARFIYIHTSKLRTQTSEKSKRPTTSPVTLFMSLNTKR